MVDHAGEKAEEAQYYCQQAEKSQDPESFVPVYKKRYQYILFHSKILINSCNLVQLPITLLQYGD
jgi:hypothetical protein